MVCVILCDLEATDSSKLCQNKIHCFTEALGVGFMAQVSVGGDM